MSEDGKYRFRLTQQMIDKLLMVSILSHRSQSTVVHSRRRSSTSSASSRRNPLDRSIPWQPLTRRTERSDSIELNLRPRRRSTIPVSEHRLNLPSLNRSAHLDEFFLGSGDSAQNYTFTTLTIAPEQDPHSIFLNIPIPSSSTTRKRKNAAAPTGAPAPPPGKRGRHRTKNLLPTDDLEWAPDKEKRPPKSTTKKPKAPMTPTATTSILNTLLQLPTNQPKQRSSESTLLKSIHQPPSFVNTILSSNFSL